MENHIKSNPLQSNSICWFSFFFFVVHSYISIIVNVGYYCHLLHTHGERRVIDLGWFAVNQSVIGIPEYGQYQQFEQRRLYTASFKLPMG